MEEWEVWCTVTVTVMVSTTAPINKKQKKVGIKYLAKILWVSSLIFLVQCSLAFLLYTTQACQGSLQGSKEREERKGRM